MGNGEGARTRVLVVISAPIADKEGGPGPRTLDAAGEWQGITRELRAVRAPVGVCRLVPPNFGALQTALAEAPGFDIVHFVGHGTEGAVILEDEFGCEEEVRADKLGALFAGRGVKVAVLNLCESAAGLRPVAQAIVDAGVPAAVGTLGPIADRHAILFAERVYSLLGLGETIGGAVDGAKQALAHRFGKQAEETVVLVGDAQVRAREKAGEGEIKLWSGEPPGTEDLPRTPGFVGRRRELLNTGRHLKRSDLRGVILTGVGGIGKTWLAARAARRNCWRFSGVVFASAKGQPDFGVRDIVSGAERALGLDMGRAADEGAREKAALGVLNARPILLALDNLETARPDARQAIARFLSGIGEAAGSGFMVTCREHVAEFDGLDGVAWVDVFGLDEDDATRLVLQLAERHTPRVVEILALDKPGQRGKLTRLVQDAGCHPFVLGLVAADAAKQGLADAVAALRALEGPWGKRVDDLIGRQVGLLEAAGRKVLMRLPIFVESVDRTALDAVVGMPGDLGEGLRQVVEASLAEFDGERGRWALHQVVLDYSAKNLRLAPDEEDRLREAAAAHYAGVLGRAGDLYLKGGEGVMQGLALFDVERGNIEAGQRWAAERAEKDDEAAALCNRYGGMGNHVRNLRQHPREQIVWLEAGLAAARRLKDKEAEGVHLGNLGIAWSELGEPVRAIECLGRALPVLRELGNKGKEGATLGNLGIAHAILGEMCNAIEYFEKAIAIHHEIGDRREEGHGIGNLGNVYAALGEMGRAIECYDRFLAIARETGDSRGEGEALGNLGVARGRIGDTAQAIEYYKQQLAVTRVIGDKRGEGNALWNMSLALDSLGKREEAIERAEGALAIREQIEDPNAEKVREQLEEWRKGQE